MVHSNNPDQSELLEGPRTSDIGTFDKILEIERELKIRRTMYPRWIDAGKINTAQADKRILIFEAMLEDYNARLADEHPDRFPS